MCCPRREACGRRNSPCRRPAREARSVSSPRRSARAARAVWPEHSLKARSQASGPAPAAAGKLPPSVCWTRPSSMRRAITSSQDERGGRRSRPISREATPTLRFPGRPSPSRGGDRRIGRHPAVPPDPSILRRRPSSLVRTRHNRQRRRMRGLRQVRGCTVMCRRSGSSHQSRSLSRKAGSPSSGNRGPGERRPAGRRRFLWPSSTGMAACRWPPPAGRGYSGTARRLLRAEHQGRNLRIGLTGGSLRHSRQPRVHIGRDQNVGVVRHGIDESLESRPMAVHHVGPRSRPSTSFRISASRPAW